VTTGRAGSERAATPEALFAARLAADRARPLVTFYDRRTGERAELSAASLANWVTKTYFLLTDEVGVEPGERAVVALPMHWLRYVVLLGAWCAGLTVTDDLSGDGRVGFGHDLAELAVLRDQVDDVFALALAPWGQGYAGPAPEGAADFVARVRPQADVFSLVRPAADSDVPAVPGRSRAELAAAAAARAAEVGLDAGGRLLIRDDGPAALDPAAWLAPLAVDGSVVLVAGASDDAVASIGAAERVTAVLSPIR
jgi:uncharacterized protein (TIGR03089 family)